MTALRKLHLYGTLADRYGEEHEVAAMTLPEAIRIVECNHPGFMRVVRHGKWHCARGDVLDSAVDLGAHAHHLYTPSGGGDFHLVPAMEGAKSQTVKTIFTIVIGGALLATGVGGALAAAALPGTGASLGLGFGMGMSSGILGLSYGTITLLGAGFLLGGISMLLAPTPQTDTAERKPTAFSFDGPANVSDEGGAIPIVIGEIITGTVTVASSVIATPAAGTGSNKGKFGSGTGMMTGTDPTGATVTNPDGGVDVGGSGGGFGAFDSFETAVN